MTKQELVKTLASKTGLTQKDSEVFLKAFQETVIDTMADGDSIKLVGFLSFEVVDTKEKKARNPRTNEEIVIPAGKKIKIKQGSELKNAVK